MPKFGTIVTLIAVSLIIMGIWAVASDSTQIISCYEANIQTFEDIEYKSRSQGWNKKLICALRQDAIVAVENCLVTAAGVAKLPEKYQTGLIDAIHKVRVDVEDLNIRKKYHDSECTEYEDTMFFPPEDI